MFACDPVKSVELERLLSSENEERFAQIQRITYYLAINGAYLSGFSALALLQMTYDQLGATSKAEIARNEEEDMRHKYRTLVSADFMELHGLENSICTLRCHKCKKPFEITMRQTRGGDEGMTAFVKCPNCGINFRS